MGAFKIISKFWDAQKLDAGWTEDQCTKMNTNVIYFLKKYIHVAMNFTGRNMDMNIFLHTFE